MRPSLGLVCITTTKEVRYRTITRKRLLSLEAGEAERVLDALYLENMATLEGALAFCAARDIRLYRIPSSIFPFADEPIGIDLMERHAARLAALGARALAAGLRLVMHPDQFVVLSSDSAPVVANSIKILEMHGRIMDALRQPRSAWATLEIHGGKGARGEALVRQIRALPEAVRSRLALENDEYTYGAEQILAICREAGVPMVFDAHHHVCHEGLTSFEHPSVAAMTRAAATTWPRPEWQMAHISNGRSGFNDRKHSDLIEDMPQAYASVPWIEVEAKHKELAVEKLQREWLA